MPGKVCIAFARYAGQESYEPWYDGVFLTNTTLRSRIIRQIGAAIVALKKKKD